MAVSECFFNDEGVRGVIIERVAKGGGLGSALGCMIVTSCLDNLAEFAVGGGETGVDFLDVHDAKFNAEIRLC